MQPSKLIENEAAFRKENEKVEKRRRELNAMAEQDNQLYLGSNDDDELSYLCECSDENCRERITMMSSVYNGIHVTRTNFIVKPGHEIVEVEVVTDKNKSYYVVTKEVLPPEENPKLQSTSASNN